MAEGADLAVYVHWPFCAAKCPYCDFNSHVVRAVDHDAWSDAFEREVDRHAAELPGRRVTSVFFGGGTPSLMAPATVERTLARIARRWRMANDAEITLEANPTSVEAGRMRGFRLAGVNRVSLGVQALEDHALRRLGRLHSVAEALAAVDVARGEFERVSFDLIYARQDQGLADWQAELGRALALGPDHLSLYQLTVEPGTRFGEMFDAGRLRGLPDEDLAADLYEATQAMTAAAGLPAYEVSNHARPGAESRHNLAYWRGADWIGIGPGAHGRFTGPKGPVRTEAHRSPHIWLDAAARGAGESLREPIDRRDRAETYLMMGLRLAEGVSLSRYESFGGRNIWSELQNLEANGLLERTGDRLRATPGGTLVLNAVIGALLT